MLDRARRSTAGRRMSNLIGDELIKDESFWSHSTWKDEKKNSSERKKSALIKTTAKTTGDDGNESVAIGAVFMDSDDDSFRESEEEEEDRIDTFDSDFNDSESNDDENGDNCHGGGDERAVIANEKVLRTEERQEKMTKKRVMVEKNVGGRKKIKVNNNVKLVGQRGGALSRRKGIQGIEQNAGIVLNFPLINFNKTSAVLISSLPSKQVKAKVITPKRATTRQPQQIPISLLTPSRRSTRQTKGLHPSSPLPTISPLPTLAMEVTSTILSTPQNNITSTMPKTIPKTTSATTIITTSENNSNGSINKNEEIQHNHTPTTPTTPTFSPTITPTSTNKRQRQIRKRKRHKIYTQEELLLEAVRITEPANERWILGRTRQQNIAISSSSSTNKGGVGGKGNSDNNGGNGRRIISIHRSRRGTTNDTITFPDMDYVPKVLTDEVRRIRKKYGCTTRKNLNNNKNMDLIKKAQKVEVELVVMEEVVKKKEELEGDIYQSKEVSFGEGISTPATE